VEAPWGANTDLFDPARLDPAAVAAVRASLGIPAGARVVAFSGSFRPWHGVSNLFDALAALLPRRPDLWALLIGDGPERAALAGRVRGWGDLGRRVVFTGRLQYAEVPRHLALADLGVAPFDPAQHAALHVVEHLTLFYTGMALWWLIITPLPSERRQPGMVRLAYLGFSRLASAAVCLPLTWLGTSLYSLYATGPHAYGMNAVTDQRLAGAAMCLLEFLVFGIGVAVVFVDALTRDERAQALSDLASSHEAARPV